MPVVITIGFVATMYPVDEDDGSAVVSVAVLFGELSGDVEVTMSTQRGSAIGMDIREHIEPQL